MMKALPSFPCNYDKHPLTGRGFYDARPNAVDDGWPLAGIPTGAISGIDVVDIDPAGMRWYDRNFDALPFTRAHSTRRGLHLLFRHAEGLKGSVGKIAPGIDVKADGGYFIWWPREGLPFEDWPICEWPNWLLAEAMKPGRHGERARLSAVPGSMPVMLEGLSPIDYRDHDDWFELMVRCRAAGVEREAFIDWSISDQVYADHAEVIGRRWDSLRITDWALRVEQRLAELNKGRCPKRKVKLRLGHGIDTCQLPLSTDLHPQRTNNLQRRVSSILREVRKGQEPLLFWASCRMREIIAEGKLNHRVAVQLLEGSWPKSANIDARRVIAAGFLTVEGGFDGRQQ